MSRAAAPRGTGRGPSSAPSQTLYVTNLPSSKIQKEDLRRALYILFSTYGPVLDVVALRTMEMRGQAHVVFRDVQTATQALRALQGFEFFDREMQIQYAKSKSNIIAKLDGSFAMPSAPSGVVTATELQQSIFSAPPSAMAAATTQAPASTLRVPTDSGDHAMEDARSLTGSAAGRKRTREEQEEEEEDSGSDVAMEEDSDDE